MTNSKKIGSKSKKIIFTFLFICFSIHSFAQGITEEHYLELDKKLWEQYETDMNRVYELFKNNPAKKDSLHKISDKILHNTLQENQKLAIKFASVPSGLQRLFMVRLDISKDTLKSVFSKLPDNMKSSPYGKSILLHINSKQINEGDKFYDFDAITSENQKFKLSSFKGRNILLVYGGLNCMGKENREYLNSLYKKTPHENLEIIVFYALESAAELKEIRNDYLDEHYLLVSDLLGDYTPVKVLYGAQATPTCFFIDTQGFVKMKTVGLNQDKINNLISNK